MLIGGLLLWHGVAGSTYFSLIEPVYCISNAATCLIRPGGASPRLTGSDTLHAMGMECRYIGIGNCYTLHAMVWNAGI